MSRSIFAKGITIKQRINRFKNKILHIRPVIIIDSNLISYGGYVEDMINKYGEGWID